MIEWMEDSIIFNFHIMAKEHFHLLGTFQPSKVCPSVNDARDLLLEREGSLNFLCFLILIKCKTFSLLISNLYEPPV